MSWCKLKPVDKTGVANVLNEEKSAVNIENRFVCVPGGWIDSMNTWAYSLFLGDNTLTLWPSYPAAKFYPHKTVLEVNSSQSVFLFVGKSAGSY